MLGNKLFLSVFFIFAVTVSAYATTGIEVNGDLKLSGSGTISFPNGSSQLTAGACQGRYDDNGNGTVTDCRSGLTWLKNTNCTDTAGGINKPAGYLNWADAGTWTAHLADGLCNLTDGSSAGDWRLPTKTEGMMMIEYARKMGYINPALTNAAGTSQWTTNGDAFSNVISAFYWTSATWADNPAGAWVINTYSGTMTTGINGFKGDARYVWPVRDGQ